MPANERTETRTPRHPAAPLDVTILPLGRAAAVEAARVGGKALSLDHLIRAGLPVPPAWVVPTDVYRAWLSQGGAGALRSLGRAVAGEVPVAQLIALLAADPGARAAAEAIQAALERTVPHRLATERFVARSSAVGEDGATHSFAGIFETFPGLRWEELGAGVVLCWASAFTPRAENYRDSAGLEAGDAPVGVMVQPMVPAVAAGVAFTADPTTGSRVCYVVNATWGLGTTLVDGRVQPDQYRIPRRNPREKSIHVVLGEKAVQEIIAPAGLETIATPGPDRGRPALAPRQVIALGRLLFRLERLTVGPQDVEWAWEGRRFWLLQARSITRLPDPAAPAIEWSRTNYRELYPELPAPLSGSYIEVLEQEWGIDYFRRRGVETGHMGPFLRLYQGRPFINYSVLKYVTLALGGEVEGNLGSFGTTQDAGLEAELEVHRVGMHRRMAIAWRYWRGRHTADRVLRYVRKKLAAAEAIDPEGMSDFTLLCQIEDAFLDMQPIDDAANDMGGALSLRRMLVEALVGRHVESLDHFLSDVTVSGPENVSVAQALDLLRLGVEARADEEARAFFEGPDDELRSYWVALASTPFLEQLRAFMRRYGHRSLHESDSAVARFREEPLPILRAIAAIVRSPGMEMPEERLARQRAAARAAWSALWRGLPPAERALPLRYLLARRTVRTMQLLMRCREGFRSEMARLIGERRRLELSLGRRWYDRGLLERTEDIYWLRLEELRRAMEERAFKPALRAMIRDRKAEYARLAGLSVANLVLETEDGIRPVQEPAAVEENSEFGLVLRGQPVSSGIAEGEIRVIQRPEDAAGMAPGTILVSPVVGPSWGPLYSIAGGLIVEMGGALSHGAILAREYALPAITNIPGVTRSLRTGDRVLLNADAGVVWRAPERPRRAGTGAQEEEEEESGSRG